MDADRSAAPSFVWPPRPMPADPATPQSAQDSGVEPPALSGGTGLPWAPPLGWLRSVEVAWMDPLGGPLAQRQQAAGWTPDDFDTYCDRCGHEVGINEATEFGCARCRDLRLPWQRFIRLGAYEAPLSEWVCEVKFSRSVRLGLQLGQLLGTRIATMLESQPGATAPIPAIVPVPTHFTRTLARGLDHAAVVAQGASRAVDGQLVRALRGRRRPSQRSLSPTRRRSNVSGTMSPRGRLWKRLEGRLVILVDDVSTTGATLREASRAILAPFGAERGGLQAPTIWVATLAVTPDRPEPDRGTQERPGRE